MKKAIYLIVLFTIATTSLHAQDPGFGDEGVGDAQDAPGAPIDGITLPLLITGITVAVILIRKKEKHLKTN